MAKSLPKPVLTLMGGGSGSGKSTLLKSLFDNGRIPERGTVRLDSDEIKKLIPEYNTLLHHDDAAASTVAHQESADILKQAFDKTLEMRSNAVLDGTMAHAPYVRQVIDAARAHGYDVHMEGVAIDPEEAIRRAQKRGEEEKRVVPLNDILPRHQGFNNNVESYAPLVDRWRLWDNNGNDFAPVAEKDPETGEIIRQDRTKYARFSRGKEYDFDGAIQAEQARLQASVQRRNARGTGISPQTGGGIVPDNPAGYHGERGTGEARPASGPGAVADGKGDARPAGGRVPPAKGATGERSGGVKPPETGPKASIRQTPYVDRRN